MSVKKTIRAFTKVARQIERDSQRRSRVATQRFKQVQNMQAIASAAEAVNAYHDYVYVLKSVHQDCSDSIDWTAMHQERAPIEPLPCSNQERAAQLALDTYKPGFFDRLFRREAVKRQRLAKAVADARQRDQDQTQTNQADYETQHAEWEERQALAHRVLLRDSNVYERVMDLFDPFDGIDHIGKLADFVFTADHIEVDLHVNTTEMMPDFVLTQLASGKLARKPLSTSKVNELYQDHVCSCLLRVGREIQAHLPVSQVVVHAHVKRLNSATGRVENQLITSAAMPRSVLSGLNFATLDPSDCLGNFVHAMKFTKAGGFQPVDRVGLAAPLRKNRIP